MLKVVIYVAVLKMCVNDGALLDFILVLMIYVKYTEMLHLRRKWHHWFQYIVQC